MEIEDACDAGISCDVVPRSHVSSPQGRQAACSCTLLTMASDPLKSRRRAMLKAIRDFFRTTPTPRSSSLQPPAHSADTVNEGPNVSGTIVKTSPARGDQLSTSDQPSQLSSSTRPGNNYSDKLVKAGSVAWSGLDTGLRLLEKSADAFPPLKSAVAGLLACLDLFEVCYFFRFHIVYHF